MNTEYRESPALMEVAIRSPGRERLAIAAEYNRWGFHHLAMVQHVYWFGGVGDLSTAIFGSEDIYLVGHVYVTTVQYSILTI